ncbi:MAG: hypothetical protein ACOCXD_00495 [Bacteroidota bacterium]
MTAFDVIFTIIGALLIGLIFYYVFKVSGPWGSLWTFLLVLILGGIAAALWVEPVGPVYYDVAWVPVFFVVLLFALILAAATPPRRGRRVTTDTEKEEIEAIGIAGLGLFFWFLLLFFIIAIAWGFNA